MNQYDYFNSEFYPRRISVSDIVDFLKNQISPDQEISSDELLQKIQYNDISEKEISMNELAKFINKKRFPDVKKDFLLENFNRIIDAQRKRDKKSKSYSRRAFLDKYFIFVTCGRYISLGCVLALEKQSLLHYHLDLPSLKPMLVHEV